MKQGRKFDFLPMRDAIEEPEIVRFTQLHAKALSLCATRAHACRCDSTLWYIVTVGMDCSPSLMLCALLHV